MFQCSIYNLNFQFKLLVLDYFSAVNVSKPTLPAITERFQTQAVVSPVSWITSFCYELDCTIMSCSYYILLVHVHLQQPSKPVAPPATKDSDEPPPPPIATRPEKTKSIVR